MNSNNSAVKTAKESANSLPNSNSGENRHLNDISANEGNASETASNLKEKISGNLVGAAEQIHKKADTTQAFIAEKIDKANEYAHETASKVNELGHRAAAALENSSEYVKNLDIADTKNYVRKAVKSRPALGIAVAGVFGLVIGLLVGRKI